MRFALDTTSPVPLYEQIVHQVVFAVASGDLGVGDMTPSVRDLSQQLIVNANTVARAYQELEREQVLEARRGLGMAVAAGAPEICRDRRKTLVRGRVEDMVREAVSGGLSLDEVLALVEAEWRKAGGANSAAEVRA